MLFVGGRLDHASAAELEAAASKHEVAARGDVVIDLSEVDYLSSSGLKVFQAIADRQTEKGRRLLLRAPSTAARLSLDLSGMLGLIAGETVERTDQSY